MKKVADPVEEARQYGIDVTLLEERLHLSPTERLERHLEALCFVEELRKAGEKVHGRIPENN